MCLAVQLGFGLLRLIWLLGPVEIGSCCASMTGQSPLPLHNMVVDQFQVVFVCLAAHIFVFDWLLRGAAGPVEITLRLFWMDKVLRLPG